MNLAMNLADYPQAIADAQITHLTAQQQVRKIAAQLEERKAQFGALVAADKSLTNDAKRKAARAELELTDPEYLDLQQRLTEAKDGSTLATIEVERLGNGFKVERLLMEMKIAISSVDGLRGENSADS